MPELEIPQPASIEAIQSLNYRWGQCQALLYNRADEDTFPQPFLTSLYYHCKHSGRAKNGILDPLFCGMTDLSHDAIVSYLLARPVIVLGEWRWQDACQEIEADAHEIFTISAPKQSFIPLGFCFPVSFHPFPRPYPTAPCSAFGAYAFFQSAWRTPQQTVLSYLGLSYLFAEYNLHAILGQRLVSNHLTRRWLQQFGFRDVAIVPNLLWNSATSELESCVVSELERTEFESLLGGILSKV